MTASTMPLIPPQTDEIRAEMSKDHRRLLHCLDCGGQVVAIRHGGSCILCSSEAVVVEEWD
ncbi:hypothetical protein [Halorientalis persicus]|nr:hypothetical protein [Halorientalis persicus]